MAELLLPRRQTGIMLVDHLMLQGGLLRMTRHAATWTCACLGMATLLGLIDPGRVPGTLILLLAPAYVLLRRTLDEFALATIFGFLLVAYVPALNFAIDGDWRHVPIMGCVLGFMALFEHVLRVSTPAFEPSAFRARDPMLLALWLGLAMIAPGVVGDQFRQYAFIVPFAISLVHFDRIVSRPDSRWWASAGYALAVLIYATFYWDHFGRLLMGAIAIMPVLILVRHRVLRVPPISVLFAMPPLLWGAQWIRGDHLTAAELANSSISSPSQLSVMMMEFLPVLPTRAGAFADQWLLFFTNWIPAALWQDKPTGLGWTIVGELTSRKGVSEGHSIAPGLVGESLWLLGDLFILGFAAQVLAILILARALRLAGSAAVVPVIATVALLPTLVWGGLASFGARAWLFIIPALAVAIAYRMLDRYSGERVR